MQERYLVCCRFRLNNLDAGVRRIVCFATLKAVVMPNVVGILLIELLGSDSRQAREFGFPEAEGILQSKTDA